MKRTTKTTATGWLWLCFGLGLCAACEDEPICVGGTGESGDCGADADAGGDGDADGDADGDTDGDADADGDADRYAAIAAAYEAERVANRVPGLAVAIVENGEIAWSQGFGNKGVDSDEVVTPSTQFRAANYFFPALALLQVVDAGLVDFDARLTSYLPGFTVSGNGPLEAEQALLVEQITIFDLLASTSGLEGGALEPTDWPDRADSVLGQYLTSPEFAQSHHLVFQPGEVAFHSALATTLMGLVVEQVARQNGLLSEDEWFPDYMRLYVFDPLGMVHSTYRVEEVEAAGDFALPTELPAAPTALDNPWMRPCYGAWTTAGDLALFARFLLRGDETVLSHALLEEALSTLVAQPGGDRMHLDLLGLMTSDGPCVVGGVCPAVGDLREHVGWGYYSGQWRYAFEVIPSHDFALVYMSNGKSRFPDADQLALTQLLGLPALAPDYPGDDHEPSVYPGRYLLDNGGTTRVSVEEDGTLRLSSPLCNLEPRAPGSFWCDRVADYIWFLFDANGEVEYLVAASRVGVPDPSEGQ